ncbi:Peptidase S1 and S6, chymotrypsin/Hap [Nitrosococcus oceani ATCC 19707]|uniref:Peptidase S1 and S6, chymotrypsin/Hap n=2 Tax=Nitrosococcus oceani TaxID=1229 RepID=Q3J9U8_NITOC|nr:serine protease [Nitrosococcus oceani]ABA58398.1 Peptidase S1 and S6, chymotrypsin/Hap [Nitrosococcus oceani ATCC 19707]EDZ66690.1 Trypsin, putative [Nitrosococcus oceani AFC27]KFI19116.1 peptidase S1 [Nitrosococcus oceani C-27]GEM18792.1 peptidase S1 [Nitrosococcus oceani]
MNLCRILWQGGWFSLKISLLLFTAIPALADLADTIEHVKQAVVGVGTYASIRGVQARYRGTGFVVADGRHVVTNAHVLPSELNSERNEYIAVFVGVKGQVRQAEKVAVDAVHDLALLKIGGGSLSSLSLGNPSQVREGEGVAFTGFPIGPVLGLYPVTHRGIVSAITPIATAGRASQDLNPQRIQQLRRQPFKVFQLDATAYPGNSGSPVYDPDTGQVLGVVNKVFVKGSKENVLKHPSGITYAIPADYVKALLGRAGLKP